MRGIANGCRRLLLLLLLLVVASVVVVVVVYAAAVVVLGVFIRNVCAFFSQRVAILFALASSKCAL